MENDNNILASYDSTKIEDQIYKFWLNKGYFKPKIDLTKTPFVIIQPPPNVTGELHLGHAQRASVEDALARWHRMKGDPTLWLPGVDHAGIATQVVVERELADQGLSRHDLGREKFIEKVWEWVEKSRNSIGEQHQRLGVSCDWSREVFTLDNNPSKAVRNTFVNFYKKGLIYRGERIINWCPDCSTALSDLEVEYQESQGKLYYISYKTENGSSEIIVATTRPETLLGDTAVAVNPDDLRYKNLIGMNVILPLLNKPIPIISDTAVDKDFGTGALKVTPGHSQVDFEIGQRHNLPIVQVIQHDGKMNSNAGLYEGMDRFDAREAIVNDLQKENLLTDIEDNTHSIGHCQRSRDIVEPIVSKQWFVNIEPLAKPAIAAVKKGEIEILPERFKRVYENWMENIRDWCISRQLWWGHRIPVWYCDDCENEIVEVEDPTHCHECNSTSLVQDDDVLDTWFSSGLWTHSTLGWPEETEDLNYFYPTTVMETGHDILFFWVARMIMMGIENMGKPPFKTVLLSGLIRDIEGTKMSKTRGNVIDPREAILEYGCDALRFALTIGTAPGNDGRLGPQKLESGRNFANKIWNAARYVMLSIKDEDDLRNWENPEPQTMEDRWILSRLQKCISDVNRLLDSFLIGEAEQVIYDFIWNDYCDWYIEVSKVRYRNNHLHSPSIILVHVMEKALRLLHPFMPFITEEIWSKINSTIPQENKQPESIMIAEYPESISSLIDLESEKSFGLLTEIIRMIRNIRAEFKITPTQNLALIIQQNEEKIPFENGLDIIKSIGRIDPLIIADNNSEVNLSGSVNSVIGDISLTVPMENLVDIQKETQRLEKELSDASNLQQNISKRLEDTQFLSKAPEEVIDREREKVADLDQRISQLVELIKQLVNKKMN
ncbi:MAG: valine--tRNA ligase [Chloroflexi bacterium]|nr:valine--tRNA ligase [Chloroflexota bacterium]|tara:strand:+ start:3626 stop:6301 length:2676 start_codon:yes stop_codon:yes gene_type:complete